MGRLSNAQRQANAAAAAVRKASEVIELAHKVRAADDALTPAERNPLLPSKEQIAAALDLTAAQVLGLSPQALKVMKDTLDQGGAADILKATATVVLPDGNTVEVPDERARNNNIKARALALDVARDVMVTAGIFASHTRSVVVQNILVAGDGAELSPILRRLLSARHPEIDVTPGQSPSVDPLFQ